MFTQRSNIQRSNIQRISLTTLTVAAILSLASPAQAEVSDAQSLSRASSIADASTVGTPIQTQPDLSGTIYGSDDVAKPEHERSVPVKTKHHHSVFQGLFSFFGDLFPSDGYGYDDVYLFPS